MTQVIIILPFTLSVDFREFSGTRPHDFKAVNRQTVKRQTGKLKCVQNIKVLKPHVWINKYVNRANLYSCWNIELLRLF